MTKTEFRVPCNCGHERRVVLSGSDRYDLEERLALFEQLLCETCDEAPAIEDFASYRDRSELEPVLGTQRDQLWGGRIRTRVIRDLPRALVAMRRTGLNEIEIIGFTTDLGVWGLLELEAALHWRAEVLRAERDALWWISRRDVSPEAMVASSPCSLLKDWRAIWQRHLSTGIGVLIG